MIKKLLRRSLSIVSSIRNRQVDRHLTQTGIRLLTKEQTIALLRSYKQLVLPATQVKLPAVHKLTSPDTIILPPTDTFTNPSFVWSVDQQAGAITLLPYGGIKLGNDVLCTDYDTDGYYKDFFDRPGQTIRPADLLIAPWSQYLDGARFGGYYDFVLLVAAKLARVKEAIPATDFSIATVAYPLFNTSYEKEYLELLGLQANQVVDSRTHAVTPARCILGNSGHWFYPNPADIFTLKKQISEKINLPALPAQRLYISRSGRRRVTNEADLIQLLKRFDFVVIEDKPRSVIEQIAIYKRASFIIGPHGASFSNIIWSEPGTQLLELFSPNYTPNFFQHMASLLDLRYTAYTNGKPARSRGVIDALEEDITVSIPEIERYLTELL
ncbi:glycosyltransferase family 61 protein [Fibrella arboris]|uniref:glycosyltransferase family 61 protein n=1 Tax=Fibrella arboris TaxID=3242486 RepID=UPI003522847A